MHIIKHKDFPRHVQSVVCSPDRTTCLEEDSITWSDSQLEQVHKGMEMFWGEGHGWGFEGLLKDE